MFLVPKTTEKVGPSFNEQTLAIAQKKAWHTLSQMVQLVKASQSETELIGMAKDIFYAAGAQKHWHRPIVRVGKNTLCRFSELSDPEVRLKESDILFFDFGPVFDNHEADVGATLILGDDSEMQRVANVAPILFGEVAGAFKEKQISGRELYKLAQEKAQAMNVHFVTEVDGHRISDFPHALYSKTSLGEFDQIPTAQRWVLEIQIRHPTLSYGAFYEDIL